jgi:fructokinase
MEQYYGAIEAGGTKFVVEVAQHPTTPPIASRTFETMTPDETIPLTIEFLRDYPLKAIGIGSFGPVDLRPDSPTYGYITSTPKLNWRNTDLAGSFKRAFNVPVGFDTDVNAVALGEWCYGAGKGADPVVYFTIGTGIGGGLIIDGKLAHGLIHPEMGHIPVQRHASDSYEGFCPYHKDCFEGMASGPALAKRWGRRAEELPSDHPAWKIEAFYLAQGICTALYMLSPERIILGGGVMRQQQLFPEIREQVRMLLNQYISSSAINEGEIDKLIVPPGLETRSGAVGALELARLALER